MFRELTRKNKQLSGEECISVLKKETRGVYLQRNRTAQSQNIIA